MKYTASFLLLLSFAACKTDNQKAEDAIRKEIKDEAFKKNQKATIYELKVLNIKPESEKWILDRQKTYLVNMASVYTNLYTSQVDLAQISVRQMKLYASIDSDNFSEMEREDAKKQLEEANKYKDTIGIYQAMHDSLDKKKIDTTKKYYLIKCFIKATIDNENTLDTFLYLANKKLEIINPMKGLILNED